MSVTQRACGEAIPAWMPAGRQTPGTRWCWHQLPQDAGKGTACLNAHISDEGYKDV